MLAAASGEFRVYISSNEDLVDEFKKEPTSDQEWQLEGRGTMNQGTIKRQVLVEGNQIAFEAGEQVEIESTQPNPQNPIYKYIIYSNRLQKRFQLSDDDVELIQDQQSQQSCPPEVPPTQPFPQNPVQQVVTQKPVYRPPSRLATFGWWKIAVIGVAVFVVIVAVVGFLVWKNANDNKMVSAKSGTILSCTQCGKEYKNDVKTVSVKNKEKGNYTVVTKKEGLCDPCAYGSVGYQYKTLFDENNTSEFWKSAVTIPQPAIEFLKAHQDCFPAPNQAVANGLMNPVDTRLISKDITPYTGTLVRVYGSVVKTEAASDGSLTFVQVGPQDGGDSFFVYYTSAISLLKGDYGYFWVLPIAATSYDTVDAGTYPAIVSIGSWWEKAGSPYGF